jgi:hypothetical protein
VNAKKIFAALLVIFVAGGGFVAGLILLRERQDIGEKAAVAGGRATVSFNPATGNYKVGDTIQTAVYFNTDNIPVSGVAVRVRYPFSGTTPEVTVTSIEANPTLLSSGGWTCPTQETRQEGGNVIIDIGCANDLAGGYATNQNTLLASISLRVQRAPAVSPLVLTFDPVESVIRRRSDNQDILNNPTSIGSFNIEGGGSVSVTPTPSTRVTSSVTPTQTPRLTSGATKTPTPSAMPDAGVGYPFVFGSVLGLAVIFAAILLAI